MEESNQCVCFWIERREVRSFHPVTKDAGEREVGEVIAAAMLYRHNVINLVKMECDVLG